jgi:hypothetical protein
MRFLTKIRHTAIELPNDTSSIAASIAPNEMELNAQINGTMTTAVAIDCKTNGSMA